MGLPLGLCISSDPDDDFPEVPSIPESIVSEWQRLASIDKESPDFLSLLSTLMTDVDRPSTIKLQDENARIVLGILDEVGTSSAWRSNRMVTYTAFSASFSEMIESQTNTNATSAK